MHASAEGRIVAWVLIAIVGVANLAGYAMDLYRQFWWFDRILHAGTILAVTLWLALFVFVRTFRGERGIGLLRALLLASVGIALGALWEVAEWGFDRVAPGDVIKGKDDTVLDILMDTAGAAVAAILALRLAGPPK